MFVCQLRPAGVVLGRGGGLYEVTHWWSHALVATLGLFSPNKMFLFLLKTELQSKNCQWFPDISRLTRESLFHDLMIAKIFDIISLIQRLNSVYFLIFWLFVKTALKTLLRRNYAAKSMWLVFALLNGLD